jgi:hypothetical protein
VKIGSVFLSHKIFKKYAKNIQKGIDKRFLLCYNGINKSKGGLKMKFLKRVLDWFVFFLTGKGTVGDEGVSADILDYSGQGRNKNGR